MPPRLCLQMPDKAAKACLSDIRVGWKNPQTFLFICSVFEWRYSV